MRNVFQRMARTWVRAFLAAATLSAGVVCVRAQEAEGIDTGVVLGDVDCETGGDCAEPVPADHAGKWGIGAGRGGVAMRISGGGFRRAGREGIPGFQRLMINS